MVTPTELRPPCKSWRKGLQTAPKHAIAKALGLSAHKVWYWFCKGAPRSSAAEFTAWINNHKARRKEASRVKRLARSARKNRARRSDPIRYAQELAQRRKHYRRNAPAERLVKALRRRVYKLVTSQGLRKSGKTLEMLGCSHEHLRDHLQRQFKPGMNWHNYGAAWHVDHIVPCSHFDLTNPQHQRTCFNWQNLRPLWALENIQRGNRLERPTQISIPIAV